MKCFNIIILLLSVYCQLSSSVPALPVPTGRYCTTAYCRQRNLACNNKGNITSGCYSGAKFVLMGKYRQTISKAFNTFRNKVASGDDYKNLQSAARMATMVWSEELEHFAKLDVARCHLSPKMCMSSPNFYYIGVISEQFSYGGYAVDRSNFVIIKSLIESWGKEVLSIRRLDTLHLPYDLARRNIYKTTLLLNERNSHFGCAALRYSHELYHHFLLSCAFATDNLVNERIYQWSARPAARCRRPDRLYKSLCAPGENYNNHKMVKGHRTFLRSLQEDF
ncbi:allergen Tab y 5.0101-like [Scaptodrosophila lebanonensis]|uniref:Allergen Tab y 5.0101-like n=1 Tax=Drosophila lebanonensis TaxID=7225 RepID=A0A6J2TC71_DROLE|nr:allergen Tab y 5.0101-like [Scaptodrosophila lebanonensis]